jgi:hypothetical protein
MPVPTVKPISLGASKWKDRAASASGVYRDGVQQTTKNWQTAASAAEPAYKAGVTAAANAGRYGKGIAKAGNDKWKHNTIAKGPDRFAQGVGIAEPAYSAGAAPFYEAIARTDLPQRGPKGSEQNYQRTAPIGKALHQLKISR